MNRLAGKIVVVTGGADGIGRGIAVAMAQDGAEVFVGDINDSLGSELAASYPGAVAFQHCDVTNPGHVESLVALAQKRRGSIDILVNNAGVAIGGMPIQEMSLDLWHRQIEVNLTSMFLSIRAALPAMLTQGRGSIVNLASMQAHVGIPGWTAYAATKGGVIAMTQQLAVEFAPAGIRVNSISPGAIQTPMNDRIVAEQGEKMMRIWAHMHPIGRIGQTSEVAAAAVFLGSDEASFITGVDLKVDGGVTLQTRDVDQQP